MVKSHTALAYVSKAICSAALVVSISGSAAAQDASAAEAEYAAVLQQIADMKMSISHKEAVLKSQEAQIASLNEQLENVEGVNAAINPMVDKMAAAINREVDKDLPFNGEERFARLDKLRVVLEDKEALPGDKMRIALGIYQAEVDYGQTFESYTGPHPNSEKRDRRYNACLESIENPVCAITRDLRKQINDGASVESLKELGQLDDGNYLRYGRLALVYAEADSSDVHVYERESSSWQPVTGGRALDYVRAIKMARGEAAIGVVTAPVTINE